VPITCLREAWSSSTEEDVRLEARKTTLFFGAADFRRTVLNLCRCSEEQTAEVILMTWMM
jgi:hypothetical protein